MAKHNSNGKPKKVLQGIIHVIDSVLMIFSPLSIVSLVIFTIILMSEFGSHVQFMNDLEERGVIRTGAWYWDGPVDKYAYVNFSTDPQVYDSALVPVIYYSSQTLKEIKKGQPVNIRYLRDGKFTRQGILEEKFSSSKYSPRFMGEFFWVWLVSFLMVLIHPELLLLGLPGNELKKYEDTLS